MNIGSLKLAVAQPTSIPGAAGPAAGAAGSVSGAAGPGTPAGPTRDEANPARTGLGNRPTGATTQADEGVRNLGAPASTGGHPQARPGVEEQLAAARAHVPDPDLLANLSPEDRREVTESYRAERSRMFDAVATQLEGVDTSRMPPAQEQVHLDQLEEAQQGAKPAREASMRADLATTTVGREMLDFERRAGVPIELYTDREAPDAGLANASAIAVPDGPIRFKVRDAGAQVYVHEMTHQVDHLTRVIFPASQDDSRTRDQVVDEATKRYRELGLDPAEVPAVVEATYDAPESGFSKTHGHTRLAEARLQRIEAGGTPMTVAELREVISIAVPREQDIEARNAYNTSHDEGALRAHARSRGIDVEGRPATEVLAALEGHVASEEARIVAITQGGGAPTGARPNLGN